MTHTKGPWKVDEVRSHVGSQDFNIMTEEGYAIADTAFYYSSIDCPKEHEANARLMAAAPDLLRACEMAHKILKDSHGFTDREFIQKAIAKAKGES